MIEMLDKWLAASTTNFTIFVGSQTLLAVLALAALLVFSSKLGKADERTDAIRYRIVCAMFYALIVMNGLFVALVDSDMQYFRQYLISGTVIALLVGAIASAYYYFRER